MLRPLLAGTVLFGSFLLLAAPARAYYSVMDTGEIMDPGHYKVTPELQFLTQTGGADVGADFDAGLSEDSGLRGQIGLGTTDFYLGGFYKYMPFPDVDNQPAIGFNAGLVYARDEGDSDITIRFEPMVSKKFKFDFGALTPYGSIPIGLQHRSAAIYDHDQNNVTAQLAIGTQVDLKTLKNVGLMAELGFDLNQAFSYVSFGAAWYFGGEGSSQSASAPVEE